MRQSLAIRSFLLAMLYALLVTTPAIAEPANLLRNARFQDDWMTLLQETKNHQWIYTTEYQNRRDYNPDGWWCKGSWRWDNADGEPRDRRMVLHAPQATVYQRTNVVLVHDDRTVSGFPDAGGFPDIQPVRSTKPLSIVHDMTFRVRVRGKDVPDGAATVQLSLCPPGANAIADALGTLTPPTITMTAVLPAGTYDWQWVEVQLKAEDWLKAATASDAEAAAKGPVLPGTAMVQLTYKGDVGEVAIDEAQLTEAPSAARSLLANGNFEAAKEKDAGLAPHWSGPRAYRYLPPRYYYLFMTWHNNGHPARGHVGLDNLIVADGAQSMQMTAATGDEHAIMSDVITLNQVEPRLIEVRALVKTDHLNMLQIDAMDDKGQRIDGRNFIHKSPDSVGTNDWREVRQVFRPREPVKSFRLLLAVRGVNGYTLDDTSDQPQSNVTGIAWWDDVRVFEPESTEAELQARGVAIPKPTAATKLPTITVSDVQLGEGLHGQNTIRMQLTDARPAGDASAIRNARVTFGSFRYGSSGAGFNGNELVAPILVPIAPGDTRLIEVHYGEGQWQMPAYSELIGGLIVEELDGGKVVRTRSSRITHSTWTTPIDLELGALYLQPERTTQFVKLNLGYTAATMKTVATAKIDVVRVDSGEVLSTLNVPADPAAIAATRERLPKAVLDDLRNLLLADVDISMLPVQPFTDAQRHWAVRVTLIDVEGKTLDTVTSQRFCRLAHDAPQPAVEKVTIDERGDLYVNGKPYIPWGAIYGYFPVNAGPATPQGEGYRDLHNLVGWQYYDGYGSSTYNRHTNDMNTLRYFPGWGGVREMKYFDDLLATWQKDNLYAATTFVTTYPPPWSVQELIDRTGGAEASAKIMDVLSKAPYAVSIGPGIEETFAVFHEATDEQLAGLGKAVEYLREKTGKPVMVGHGGMPIRQEFDKVPYFDVYDPETEPIHPAPVHVELAPVIAGKAKTMWLRPQMYESVPYERWRYHVYTELIRGVRGWQMAHGPGDQSLFRGLLAELRSLEPAIYSKEPAPDVTITPAMEHMTRRIGGNVYVIAATTHPDVFGRFRYVPGLNPPAGIARVTGDEVPNDQVADLYGYFNRAGRPPMDMHVHGTQWMPMPERFNDATSIAQWVRLDPKDPPRSLAMLVRGDGNYAHVVHWGDDIDWPKFRENLDNVHWFMHAFYRHAPGIISWGTDKSALGLPYVPLTSHRAGPLPAAGEWVKLEASVDSLELRKDGAVKLIDGVAMLHTGGHVAFAETSVNTRDDKAVVIWGDVPGGISASDRSATRIAVPGLKKGAMVRVHFEDRTIIADHDGSFVDDFSGTDLYQRYGSMFHKGYGYLPVAFHIYEIPAE